MTTARAEDRPPDPQPRSGSNPRMALPVALVVAKAQAPEAPHPSLRQAPLETKTKTLSGDHPAGRKSWPGSAPTLAPPIAPVVSEGPGERFAIAQQSRRENCKSEAIFRKHILKGLTRRPRQKIVFSRAPRQELVSTHSNSKVLIVRFASVLSAAALYLRVAHRMLNSQCHGYTYGSRRQRNAISHGIARHPCQQHCQRFYRRL